MADQIIVATFNNTHGAYDAASALKALKDKGIQSTTAAAAFDGKDACSRENWNAVDGRADGRSTKTVTTWSAQPCCRAIWLS